MNRKRFPLTLWIGIFFASLLLFVAIAGPYISPYDVTHQEHVHMEEINGKSVVVTLPIPPGEKYWLGTDKWGYDLLTLILHGARYTVFITILIALLRVLIGTFLGVWIGLKDSAPREWIALENAWSYLPTFIPVYFVLVGINFNSPFSTPQLISVFVLVMTAFGIPSVVSTIRLQTSTLKEQTFILAAKSLGADPMRIMWKHILPQLKEQAVITFIIEAISVMTIMGLLGIFNVFIGGTLVTFQPTLYHSMTHEWAGLVGQYRSFAFSNTLWVFLSPLGAFVMSIASFQLLAKGLKDYYQKNYQRSSYI